MERAVGLMIQGCAYCKQKYGEKPPYDDRRITHGCCDICYPIIMAEIDDTSQNLTAIAAESSGVSKIECHEPNPGTAKRYATDIRGVAAVDKVTGTY